MGTTIVDSLGALLVPFRHRFPSSKCFMILTKGNFVLLSPDILFSADNRSIWPSLTRLGLEKSGRNPCFTYGKRGRRLWAIRVLDLQPRKPSFVLACLAKRGIFHRGTFAFHCNANSACSTVEPTMLEHDVTSRDCWQESKWSRRFELNPLRLCESAAF